MVKTPAFFTCSVATSAKVAIIFVHWDFFTSVAVAMRPQVLPLSWAWRLPSLPSLLGPSFPYKEENCEVC